MTWNYPYFTEKEMQCKCGCKGLPKHEFMQKLVTTREECGFPFIVTSGYRCPEYNNQVSGSGFDGPHVLGLAADIQVYGERALKLIEKGIKHGLWGIGVSQKDGSAHTRRYVHIDCVPHTLRFPRPYIWSY